MILPRVWVLVLCLLSSVDLHFACAADSDPKLRVMSFNIRYGTAGDGVNKWDLRKEFLVETIEAFNPDLLGTQETLGFQRDYLAKELPAYDSLGVGRNDGREDGEMMALYFRKDRFEKLDSGHFWLSESPDKPGSKSWGSSLPRMVSWVKLRDRKASSAPPIAYFNTHFDHLGAAARLESARLLRRKALQIAQSGSIIITGDFNASENSPPYRALFEPEDNHPSPFVDTFRFLHKTRTEKEGTFSGFLAVATNGPRIDWIAVSHDWKIIQADIDRTQRDGRTPSDHFPVTAILERSQI